MPTYSLLVTTPTGQLQQFRISKPRVTVGRAALNDIVISDETASRTHARLHVDEQGVLLEDLASANGTRVNGTRVMSARISGEDVITIGGHTARLAAAVADGDEENRTQEVPAAGADSTTLIQSFETIVNDTSLPRLAIATPGRIWEVMLQPDVTVIGRAPDCHVVIDSTQVSRRHAQIEREHDGFRVRDLTSRNGTWVAGRRVRVEVLRDGDTLTIGHARCVFKAAFSGEDLTTAVHVPSAEGRRPVVIVPGVMGSNLYRGETQVWPNVRLMLTDPDLFRYPGTVRLEPRGLVSEIVVIPNLIKQDQVQPPHGVPLRRPLLRTRAGSAGVRLRLAPGRPAVGSGVGGRHRRLGNPAAHHHHRAQSGFAGEPVLTWTVWAAGSASSASSSSAPRTWESRGRWP